MDVFERGDYIDVDDNNEIQLCPSTERPADQAEATGAGAIPINNGAPGWYGTSTLSYRSGPRTGLRPFPTRSSYAYNGWISTDTFADVMVVDTGPRAADRMDHNFNKADAIESPSDTPFSADSLWTLTAPSVEFGGPVPAFNPSDPASVAPPNPPNRSYGYQELILDRHGVGSNQISFVDGSVRATPWASIYELSWYRGYDPANNPAPASLPSR